MTLSCQAQDCNGFPKVTVLLDNNILFEADISESKFDLSIPLDHNTSTRCLQLVRHDKTDRNILLDSNGHIIKDQSVEILQIKIDQVLVPQFFISSHCQFEFGDQCHPGSCFIGPNGVWSLRFQTPIVQYILDQKILHESQYNQDYQFPWSYKLGPDSVKNISSKIDSLIEKISISL